METVYVRVTTVYGKEIIYPVCEKAQLFAQIAGTTSLTRSVIQKICKLGYCLEVEQPKVSLS